MGLLDRIDTALTTARAGHSERKKASEFMATVKPGHTYYSVVNLHAKYPGAPKRALMEFTFSKPGRLIGQVPRSGHMDAATAWLSYGPLHAVRPPKLMTFKELTNRPDMFGPDAGQILDAIRALESAKLTPAGV
jgi:hypothetical protein